MWPFRKQPTTTWRELVEHLTINDWRNEKIVYYEHICSCVDLTDLVIDSERTFWLQSLHHTEIKNFSAVVLQLREIFLSSPTSLPPPAPPLLAPSSHPHSLPSHLPLLVFFLLFLAPSSTSTSSFFLLCFLLLSHPPQLCCQSVTAAVVFCSASVTSVPGLFSRPRG